MCCKAIKEMLEESREEGRAEAIAEIISEAKVEGRLITLAELVQEGALSIEKAAAKANMTVEQFAKVMKEILEEKE